MRKGLLGGLQRALLLCALALGMVGMHHLAAGDHSLEGTSVMISVAAVPAAPVIATPVGDDGHMHEIAHMCMAALVTAVAALVALWLLLLLLRTWSARISVGLPPPRPLGRPPDRRAAIDLSALCVLRL